MYEDVKRMAGPSKKVRSMINHLYYVVSSSTNKETNIQTKHAPVTRDLYIKVSNKDNLRLRRIRKAVITRLEEAGYKKDDCDYTWVKDNYRIQVEQAFSSTDYFEITPWYRK